MMTGILRATIIVALATPLFPATALAQHASSDSLVRRIEVLERTTTDLERRVRELEAIISREPSQARSVAASPNWQDLQNWRRLRRGMTMDEVRALLGEPERVEALGSAATIWTWDFGAANVRFDGSSGKLEAWSEPGR